MSLFGLFDKKDKKTASFIDKKNNEKDSKVTNDKDADSVVRKNFNNFNSVNRVMSPKKWTNIIKENKDDDGDGSGDYDDSEEFRKKLKEEEQWKKDERKKWRDEIGHDKNSKEDRTKKYNERDLEGGAGDLGADLEEMKKELEMIEEIEKEHGRDISEEYKELSEEIESEKKLEDIILTYRKYRKKRKQNKLFKEERAEEKAEKRKSHSEIEKERREHHKDSGLEFDI